MDRQLAERMVGAACLLAVLVLVVPAVLDGNPDAGSRVTHPPPDEALDLRTHTIRLDGEERELPVPTPLQAAPGPASPGPVEPPAAAAGESPAPPAPAAAPPASKEPVRPLAREPVMPPEPAPPAVAAARPAPPPAVGGEWAVQLGSFSQRSNAERLVRSLEAKGFPAVLQSGGGTSGRLFRVRAGPVPDRDAAEALAARLAAAGFKGGQPTRQ